VWKESLSYVINLWKYNILDITKITFVTAGFLENDILAMLLLSKLISLPETSPSSITDKPETFYFWNAKIINLLCAYKRFI